MPLWLSIPCYNGYYLRLFVSKKIQLQEKQHSAIGIAVLLGICFLSLGAFVAINSRLPWLLFAAIREVKKSGFWRSRIAQ